MKRHSTISYMRSFTSASVLLVSALHAQAAGYTLQPAQLAGAYSTVLTDINNGGVAVGYAATNINIGVTTAIVYANGTLSNFTGPPNSVSSDLDGITNDGTLVGNYSTTLIDDGFGYLYAGPSQIFSYKSGTFRYYTIPGLDSPNAAGVSPNGRWIVGTYSDQHLGTQGFVFDTGLNTVTVLHHGGAPVVVAAGANDAGKVVGYDRTPFQGGGRTGFGWIYDIATNTFADASIPGALRSAARDISAAGIVSGYFGDPRFQKVDGFTGLGGSLQLIDAAGALATYVLGANENAILVGYYATAHDGTTTGFVATPVPEPSGALMFLFGFAALIAVRFTPRTSLGGALTSRNTVA